jgi:hypothetical protein
VLSGSPVPSGGFPGEVEERAGDFGVIWNEITIVSGEAKELANFGWVMRGFPLSYTVKFTWIHTHLVPSNDYAQVLDFVFGKFALGGLEVEVIIVQFL